MLPAKLAAFLSYPQEVQNSMLMVSLASMLRSLLDTMITQVDWGGETSCPSHRRARKAGSGVNEGRVRKLRDGASGPVFGVRTAVGCGCGQSFHVTLTVGVDHPVVWCPRCRTRSRLRVQWDVRGALCEGARVYWRLRE